MNKITASLSEILMSYWLQGWPEYSINAIDDDVAIIMMRNKVAKSLRLDPEDQTNQERIGLGLVNIAVYCRNNYRWASRNIFYANMCFQTLYNEMKAKSRLQQIKDPGYQYKK